MLLFCLHGKNDRIRALMIETNEVAQNSKQRQEAINKARAAHHKSQKATKKRLDAYVEETTKDTLKQIKAKFEDVKNEGQAVDKAAELAQKHIDENP